METVAIKRLTKELADAKANLPFGCRLDTKDTIFHWHCYIEGPLDSPFQGRYFEVDIYIPTDYPNSPPDMKFRTSIYHPNIKGNGVICLEILKKNQWESSFTISSAIIGLHYLLANPNPHDPLVLEIADVYKKSKTEYEKTAKQWTQNYAIKL